MSCFFRCDWCNARVTGRYDGSVDRWFPPVVWRSFSLDDWKIDGCCQEHLDLARDAHNELTPFADSREGTPLP